jgi:hypothetical protein
MAEPTHKDPWPEGNVPNPIYKSIAVIRDEIKSFVIPYFEVSDLAGLDGLDWGMERWLKANEVVFKAYYADYDWVMLCTIFGTMMYLPEGFPMYCVDLKQELDRKTKLIKWNGQGKMELSFNDKLSVIKGRDAYPKQKDEHSAAADARWNLELDRFILDDKNF